MNAFGILEGFSFGILEGFAFGALSEQIFHPADQNPEPHVVLEPALPTLADELDNFVESERGKVEDFLCLGRVVMFGFTERYAYDVKYVSILRSV